MKTRILARQFEAYTAWRRTLADKINLFSLWLIEQGLIDPQTEAQLSQMQTRLAHDQLVVAFVAEFSRGKSELINAIFFADFGQRVLPSSAGRTTMCPTELYYTPTLPPSVRLLPIETRLRQESVAELKGRAQDWVSYTLDVSSAEKMRTIISEVSRTKRIPVEKARELGLYHDNNELNEVTTAADDTVEVPTWRHALINFPHPLLQQGLVVLDTPGLNAVGTEPELTLNLLPNAHAVLFLLSADAGVTKTDIETWRHHIAQNDPNHSHQGRIAVLNKIDSMWDSLRSPEMIDHEISRQVESTATLLGIPLEQVYPVSAQKGLVAKITGDEALLERSRLPALENALSGEILPARRAIIGQAIAREIRAIADATRSMVDLKTSGVHEQLEELGALKGKNRDVVEHMLDKVRHEREVFERGLAQFTAVRSVFAQETNRLFTLLGIETLRQNAMRTRQRIEDSPFTKGVRTAMNDFFSDIRAGFDEGSRKIEEIHAMMRAMYERFATDRGAAAMVPPQFSLDKYRWEVDRLERAYNVQLNTLWNMLSKEKYTLQRKFFETIASRMKHVYDIANRDVETWLKRLMTPLENQVREHQAQLKRRVESIKRIHSASSELEEKITELTLSSQDLAELAGALDRRIGEIEGTAVSARQEDRTEAAA